jgi:hypothetical protein
MPPGFALRIGVGFWEPFLRANSVAVRIRDASRGGRGIQLMELLLLAAGVSFDMRMVLKLA